MLQRRSSTTSSSTIARKPATRSRPSTGAGFAAAYAMFGAQRNTRLLGLWVRLLQRDGKPHYLKHIPRTWGYLGRNLRNPALAALAAWYDAHFPPSLRQTMPGSRGRG